jgi:hypothetical protein
MTTPQLRSLVSNTFYPAGTTIATLLANENPSGWTISNLVATGNLTINDVEGMPDATVPTQTPFNHGNNGGANYGCEVTYKVQYFYSRIGEIDQDFGNNTDIYTDVAVKNTATATDNGNAWQVDLLGYKHADAWTYCKKN